MKYEELGQREEDLDSKEELYFSWYLDELVDRGFVSNYTYHNMSFRMSDPVRVPWHEKLKTKVKSRERTLMQGMEYVPDFVIVWTRDSRGVFIDDPENGCTRIPQFVVGHGVFLDDHDRSIVDTKGSYDPNNMNRFFEMKRKWIWNDHGVFINKIVPYKLFEKTFTPQRYLLTDRTLKTRKLHYDPRTLDQFMEIMR